MKLLIDGKNAFKEILDLIDQSKKLIEINMFIWRDDEIGNEIAQHLLAKANEGISIHISKDRYGVILEKSEEARKSFFHKKLSFKEKIKVFGLNLLYPMENTPSKKTKDSQTDLYLKLVSNPLITVETPFKADHSKYYIFDHQTLILGGINIEDKENGKDMQNRIYNDYMVRIDGTDMVESFRNKMNTPEVQSIFQINLKKPNRFFEVEQCYLDLINESKDFLFITMAYFSPLKKFINSINDAYQRGVKITIVIPDKANYQDSTNKKAMKILMKKTSNGIKLLYSPKMTHTKALMNEKRFSFGSTNITKKAFNQLNELNLSLKNDNEIYDSLKESIIDNQMQSKRVEKKEDITYNHLLAFFEGFLV